MTNAEAFLNRNRKILDTSNPDWFGFFINAYQDLDEQDYTQLVNMLRSFFATDYESLWNEIEAKRENAAYYVLSRSIEGWLDDSDDSFITFLQFRMNYLNNYLGYGMRVFREFLKDNASEFDVEYLDHDEVTGHSSVIRRKE